MKYSAESEKIKCSLFDICDGKSCEFLENSDRYVVECPKLKGGRDG